MADPVAELANEVLRAYSEAEEVLIERVARRLARGITDEGWPEQKLREIRALRAEVEAQVASLDTTAADTIEDGLENSYQAGATRAAREAGTLSIEGTTLVTTDVGRLRTLQLEALTKMRTLNAGILRQTLDAYRTVIAQSTQLVLTGATNRLEATQSALNRFADKGITGFRDSAGRRWDLASYSEMATRSAAMRATVTGHVNKVGEMGIGKVIVSNSPEECPLCRPFEGRVLRVNSLVAGDELTVDQATDQGLFHANCTHRTHAFIEGLTEPYTDTANPRGYEDRQHQRALERNIRRWKRRQSASIEDKAKALADRKVAEHQAKMREFIEDSGRLRRYDREQLIRGKAST